MKALLDENIDVRLKKYFDGSEHEVVTVKDMGWNGLKNGVTNHEKCTSELHEKCTTAPAIVFLCFFGDEELWPAEPAIVFF